MQFRKACEQKLDRFEEAVVSRGVSILSKCYFSYQEMHQPLALVARHLLLRQVFDFSSGSETFYLQRTCWKTDIGDGLWVARQRGLVG